MQRSSLAHSFEVNGFGNGSCVRRGIRRRARTSLGFEEVSTALGYGLEGLMVNVAC